MGIINPVATDSSGNAITSSSMQTLGKDDFLQLLVTKLQYQDPLNPASDEDFIAQLAQFSSLEQMSNISDGISTSNQWDYLQMQSLNNVMASGFIGKEVRAEYDSVYFDGKTGPTISYTTDRAAQNIKFTVKNAAGEVVTTFTEKDIAAGTHSVKWNGKDKTGNTVDAGSYTITAEGTTSADATFTPSLALQGVCSKVVYRDGSAYVLVNGTEIALGDIREVGEPGTLDGE